MKAECQKGIDLAKAELAKLEAKTAQTAQPITAEDCAKVDRAAEKFGRFPRRKRTMWTHHR